MNTPRTMKFNFLTVTALLLTVSFTLVNCGGGGGATAPPAGSGSPPVTAIISTGGGTVTGPDGVQVVIPAGALSQPTTIGIALSSAGAPAPLQEGNAPAGPIYEFTPHDLVFNTPVTIRIPVPPSGIGAEVFMASLGADWQVNNATLVNGFAEWQRNSLSFGMAGVGCAPQAGDLYPCAYPSGGATVTATTSTAITQIAPGWLNFGSGSAGSWRVNPPGGTVSVTLHYSAAPDCRDGGGGGALSGHVKLIRWNPAVPLGTPGRVTTVFDQTVALTLTPVTPPPGTMSHGGGPTSRGVGSTTVDVSAHLGDATNAFGFTFSCQRPGRPVHTGGDLITIIGPMAAPTYTIGGTVSGLTGTGLVLRNNGGDDESVPANATAFTFNTAIPAGTGYSASVLAQPSGQTCAVQNGTGTANANVTNVAVSCSTGSTKAWQGAALLDADTGEALGPQIAFDANGSALAVWYQPLGGTYKIWARRYVPSTGWGTVEQIPTTDNTFDYRAPQIAFDANGDAIVVFVGELGGEPEIWAARYTALGTSWGSITSLTGNGNSPQIAIDSSGNAMVVWQTWTGGNDIVATRYEATTGTWQVAGPIEAGAGSASDPQIAVDASGNAMAVWSQWNGSTRFDIRANRYAAGTGWGADSSIDTGANPGAERPQIASDAAGNIMAVWQQSDGTATSIYSNRYSAGSWGSAALVETSANFADQSAIAMSGNGEAIVVWKEVDANDVHSIWARRYVAGVGGTAARIDGGTQFTTGGFPQIAIDASGNAMAVWEQSGDIWANRYMAGTGWGVATLIDNTAAGGFSGDPQIAVDGNTGDAAAVWVRVGISAPADIWGNVFR